MLPVDQLDRAARAWLEWSDESYANSIAMVAKACHLDATVVAANLAAITERACYLRAEDARKIRHVRSLASRKAARSKGLMREARRGQDHR